MAEPLSPAAQKVLDAFWMQPGDRSALAAALRVLVEQTVPADVSRTDRGAQRRNIRRAQLAIAAELEGGATTPTTPQEAQ